MGQSSAVVWVINVEMYRRRRKLYKKKKRRREEEGRGEEKRGEGNLRVKVVFHLFIRTN